MCDYDNREVEIFKNLKIGTMIDYKSEWFAYRNTNGEQRSQLFALVKMQAASSIHPCLSVIKRLKIEAANPIAHP